MLHCYRFEKLSKYIHPPYERYYWNNWIPRKKKQINEQPLSKL